MEVVLIDWRVRERQPGLKAKAFVYDLGPIEAQVQAARLLHESCFVDFSILLQPGGGHTGRGGGGGSGRGAKRWQEHKGRAHVDNSYM